jgi:prepilin-type processing-associated H-X9-DG protein
MTPSGPPAARSIPTIPQQPAEHPLPAHAAIRICNVLMVDFHVESVHLDGDRRDRLADD